jgi:hypothetical protein
VHSAPQVSSDSTAFAIQSINGLVEAAASESTASSGMPSVVGIAKPGASVVTSAVLGAEEVVLLQTMASSSFLYLECVHFSSGKNSVVVVVAVVVVPVVTVVMVVVTQLLHNTGQLLWYL